MSIEKEKYIRTGQPHTLADTIALKIKRILQSENVSPMVKASCSWTICSDQLRDILGKEVYNQWFKNVKPIVVSDNVLLLETQSTMATRWISTHYHELVDVLLSLQDKNLTSFFIDPRAVNPNFNLYDSYIGQE